MIIVKIHGGLGNQMFQYCFGLNLSLIHNVDFKIDYSYLKKTNQSGRTFRMNGFNIKNNEATPQETDKFLNTFQKILDRYFRKTYNKKHIKERDMRFDSKILEINEGYFDGHWQSEKYFQPHEKEIRETLKLKNPLCKASQEISDLILSSKEPTSIHIRRGDYVSIGKITKVHGVLGIDYYDRAIKEILSKCPEAHFFISSDDIEWAKNNLKIDAPKTFVSKPDIPDYEEMFLMSLCKNNIIANSTFSWWGAWLNQKPNKIIIAPQKWYEDQTKDVSDLVIPTWIRI